MVVVNDASSDGSHGNTFVPSTMLKGLWWAVEPSQRIKDSMCGIGIEFKLVEHVEFGRRLFILDRRKGSSRADEEGSNGKLHGELAGFVDQNEANMQTSLLVCAQSEREFS